MRGSAVAQDEKGRRVLGAVEVKCLAGDGDMGKAIDAVDARLCRRASVACRHAPRTVAAAGAG